MVAYIRGAGMSWDCSSLTEYWVARVSQRPQLLASSPEEAPHEQPHFRAALRSTCAACRESGVRLTGWSLYRQQLLLLSCVALQFIKHSHTHHVFAPGAVLRADLDCVITSNFTREETDR